MARVARRRSWGVEAALQKSVVAMLQLHGRKDIVFFKVTNEGKRSPALAAEFKRQGLRAGVADLCLVIDGVACFLELKKPGEKPTAEQYAFGRDVQLANGMWAYADTFDQAIKQLTFWGALRTKLTTVAA